MTMRIIRKYAVIIIAAIMILLTMPVHAYVGQDIDAIYSIEFKYNSELDEYLGEVYLETDVHLSAGSFGIRYNPSLSADISFELDTKNFAYGAKPYEFNNIPEENSEEGLDKYPNPEYTLEDGSNYKAFSWLRESDLTGRWHLGDIHIKNVSMTTDNDGRPIPAGWHKQTLCPLNWLETSVSQDDFFTDITYGVGPDGSINSETWRALEEDEVADNYIVDYPKEQDQMLDEGEGEEPEPEPEPEPETDTYKIKGYFQGQYQKLVEGEDGNLTPAVEWIDIRYRIDFGGELPDPPNGHTVAGQILSYDPNKRVNVKLSKDNNTYEVKDIVKKAYPDGRILSLYMIEGVEDGEYTLEVTKEFHLTYKANVTVSNDLQHDVGQMSCGDLNGDGRIKLNDRTTLIFNMNRRNARCDLNGDGKITVHDLDILKKYYNETCK